MDSETYDPQQPEIIRKLTKADLLQLLDVVQDSVRDSLRAYLRCCSIPVSMRANPLLVHMLLTSNVCHFFATSQPIALPANYQDVILEHMVHLGYEHYCNTVRLHHLYPHSRSIHCLFSSIASSNM